MRVAELPRLKITIGKPDCAACFVSISYDSLADLFSFFVANLVSLAIGRQEVGASVQDDL